MEHGKLAEKKEKKRMKCCFDMSPSFQLPGKRLLFSLRNNIEMKLQLNKIKIVIKKKMLVLADPPWRCVLLHGKLDQHIVPTVRATGS